MTSRLKKASYTTIVGLGLFAGAAGIATASNGGTTPAPAPALEPAPPAPVSPAPVSPALAPLAHEAPEANETGAGDTADTGDEVDGVDCEDGIDATTGAECDGGPAANQDNDPNEPAGTEDAND